MQRAAKTAGSIPHVQASLTLSLMLVLDSQGLSIPALDTFDNLEKYPRIRLDLAGLVLLSTLAGPRCTIAEVVAEVAAKMSSSPEQVYDLLSELSARNLLSSGLSSGAPTAAPPPLAASIPGVAAHSIGALLVVSTPTLICLSNHEFEFINHQGEVLLRLSPVELSATSEFREPATTAEALKAHQQSCGRHALNEFEFMSLVERLRASRLLQRNELDISADGPGIRRSRMSFSRERVGENPWQRFHGLNERIRADVKRFEEAEAERERSGCEPRIRVVSVQENGTIPPLALGTIVAAAKAHQGGRLNERYAFYPDWMMRPWKLRGLSRRPAVFLFSNYCWSQRNNLAVSRKVKELNPLNVTIHGGPNTPKYERDCEEYFAANPDVDIVVRGEGETAAVELLTKLLDVIGREPLVLSPLNDVAGISFREKDRIVRTADRQRIVELDSIPSPYLDGLFNAYEGISLGIFESNRGCPYSCTFCDWGSAINQRVRSFSLERVFEELEWLAGNRVAGFMCADANFGIFERDVQVAEKVAELKKRFGYPNAFSCNFAKNNTTHTRRIIELLAEAGVISKGNIAFQSMDRGTLAAVRRSNIKLEKYEELSAEFRKAGLPLFVDIMYGLPGQTLASFCNDLQGCIDRGVFARLFMTELLPNSPMNDPQYRALYNIQSVTSPDGIKQFVVSTTTFSRQDYDVMNELRQLFVLGDIIGMLRHVSHWIRSETGIREIDFYQRLRRDIRSDPERWPVLAFSLRALTSLLMPPASWALVMRELRDYLVQVWQIAEDEALDTVLAVQLAVLPARGRDLPQTLSLAHDYSSWYRETVAAKQAGHHHDWPALVPRLCTFGPASFTVDDPDEICDRGIGSGVDGDLYGSFELRSQVSRSRPVALANA